MSDLSERPSGLSNVMEYSVSELSYALKRTVEETYDYVRVRGEISGFKRAASGHLYMALKDSDALLDAVCWKGTALKLPVAPQDGLEVVATGKLTTYPGRSKYQLVISAMEPAGVGALMALLEERKKKLAAEGLFDPSRKRPLPFLPKVIGVVTSPTGAVIRDILHRLADRFPRDVLVWPVLVQGDGAAAQIAAAIRGFNAMAPGGDIPRPDLLIVARGGGSLEDLWAFNEEVVVRAAAESAIPLISAVGHETDTTLIDYVSDLRAPTPTAAAEKAVPVKVDLVAALADLGRRLDHGRTRAIADRLERLRGLSRGLPQPQAMLALPRQRLDDIGDRLPRALVGMVDRRAARLQTLAAHLTPVVLRERVERGLTRLGDLETRAVQAMVGMADRRAARLQTLAAHLTPVVLRERVERGLTRIGDLETRAARAMDGQLRERKAEITGLARLLATLNYGQVLKRGFALVRNDRGQPVTAAAGVAPGGLLSIEFADGKVAAQALGDDAAKPTKSSPKKAQKTPSDDGPGNGQGTLL